MAWLISDAEGVPHFASTEWIRDLLEAEFETSAENFESFNLHVDFGGMISTNIPWMFLDSPEGEFRFLAHQRSGLHRIFQKAVKEAEGEYVKIRSQCFYLVLSPEHALDILFRLEDPQVVQAEKEADQVCESLVKNLRGIVHPQQLSPQHRLDVN